MKRIEKKDVEKAAADLKKRGLLSDTGPGEQGVRSAGQWLNAIGEDTAILQMQLEDSLRTDLYRSKVLCLKVALKEARRLHNDIYRFAKDVHGISKEEIDNYQTYETHLGISKSITDEAVMTHYSWRVPGTSLRISKPRILVLALHEHIRMRRRHG